MLVLAFSCAVHRVKVQHPYNYFPDYIDGYCFSVVIRMTAICCACPFWHVYTPAPCERKGYGHARYDYSRPLPVEMTYCMMGLWFEDHQYHA